MASTSASSRPSALIGWRVLALVYDMWPVIAMWMVASLVFTIGFTVGGHGSRENIAPFSALQWLLWLICWLITGGYALLSWRRGGQTLGMRPWRLKVVSADGVTAPDSRALLMRFVVGTASLLLAGLGFWWAFVDRERLTWHDRASGTRMVRLAKRS